MKSIAMRIDGDMLSLRKFNCLEIAAAYCLDALGKDYKQFFLLYLKCRQCYLQTDTYREELLYPVKPHSFLTDILNMLGAELSEKLADSLHDFVKKTVDDRRPVFFSGDLSELYYSTYYQTNPGRHVFLIHGYDNDTGLYAIVDNNHVLPKRLEYAPFLLEQKTAAHMLDCYERNFQQGFVCSIGKTGMLPAKNQLLERLMHEICSAKNFTEQLFLEGKDEMCLDSRQINSNKNITIKGNRMLTNKEVFFQMLSEELKKYVCKDLYVQITKQMVQICGLWRRIMYQYLINICKDKTFGKDMRMIMRKAADGLEGVDEAVRQEYELKKLLGSFKFAETDRF